MNIAIFRRYLFAVSLFTVFFTSTAYTEQAAPTQTDYLSRLSLGNDERAAEVAKQIENADKSKNIESAYEITREVSENITLGSQEVSIIKYSDTVIHESIVDLLFKLCAKYKKNFNDTWFGDSDEPVIPYFQIMAESTFSPRLYEDEVFFPHKSGLMIPSVFTLKYLSYVNTTQTLQIMLNSYYHPEYHCLIHTGKTERKTNLEDVDALQLLSLFCTTSPDLLRQNRKDVLAFLERTLAHTEKYPKRYAPDYDARSYALDILDFYNNPEDASFALKIADNLIISKLGITNKRFSIEDLKSKAVNLSYKLKRTEKKEIDAITTSIVIH
jgi:hypothetical protein